MIGNNTLEYVASGISSTGFVSSNSNLEVNYLKQLLNLLNTNKEHQFSFLFNAHMEKPIGQKIKELYNMEGIYSDSGGLQIITQGLELNEDLKQKVYHTQGLYSSYAMSFDEIPVVELSQTSARMDYTSRFFDSDNYKEKAKLSGINLNNQINKFKEMGVECKPLMILQGNCYDTFLRWTEIVYNEVEVENRKFIGGIAMGSPAIGFGLVEDIQKIFYYTQISEIYKEIPKHLHILGVGSISRLIPLISFMKNGLLHDTHISYDSTTASHALFKGQVFLDTKTINFGKYYNKIWDEVYEKTKELVNFLDVDKTEFLEVLKTPDIKNLTKKFNNEDKAREIQVKTKTSILTLTVFNFMNFVDCMIQNNDIFLSQINPKEWNSIYNLGIIKDAKDYFEWERINLKYLNSKKVKPLDSQINILEFFN